MALSKSGNKISQSGIDDLADTQLLGPVTATRQYATAKDVLARVSVYDLAESAAPDNRAVDGEILRLALTNQDLSAYSDADRQAVSDAIGVINEHLSDASAEVEGYISVRYPTLAAIPRLFVVHTISIALYRLMGGDDESTRYRDYQAAIRYLEKVNAGTINLQIESASPASNHSIAVATSERVFDKDTLRGFGS